jgi:hypothetical protein
MVKFTEKYPTPSLQALDKIKDILEDSDMIKLNNKRYWDFHKLVEITEKEIKEYMYGEQ